MVVVDALHGETAAAAAVADDLFGGGADLQAFFDHAPLQALEAKATGGGAEGEEELEWLSNKDAFPTVETMAPSAPRRRTKGVPRPRWSPPQAPAAARRCRHCGTEETPQWRAGPEGPSTLCNACGVRYMSGRLVPEYRPVGSPTFSPELHSNRHSRVVELRRRREAEATASPAAAGNGEEKGDGKLERLSNKGEFLAVQMMAAAAARPRTDGVRRPRTEGMRRPRKAVAWPAVAWSPPPPPRAPAAAGRRPKQGGGAGVGDDGVGGCAAGDQGRAAVPADGGFNSAGPLSPAAAAPERPCQQFGTEKTLQWIGPHEGRSTLCDACGVRYRSGSMVPPVHPPAAASNPTFSPELRLGWHNRVELHLRPAKFPPAAAAGVGEEGKEELEWPSNKDAFPALKGMAPAWAPPRTKRVRQRRRVLELSPRRTSPPLRQRGGEAGRVGDGGPAAAPAGGGEEPAARAAALRRQCRHCGTEKTPQWRVGPEGSGTLCNACGVRYRSGGLEAEYRPASSPTFSPGLHSNCHREVEQLRRRREKSAEVCPAAAVVAGAGAAAAGDK
ncbi:unnamed protein product [Urochloa decumbens]|uniref:GATA-type domain-containing protein n=1 Tax=Urochloa decumbens TaxID=240449 RepID=A0ABC8WYH4_9POAL